MASKLLQDLAIATGLPEKLIQQELKQLVRAAGIAEQDLTLENLREILAGYAQDILLSAKQNYEKKASGS